MNLIIKTSTKYGKYLARHLAKEHPKTAGHIKAVGSTISYHKKSLIGQGHLIRKGYPKLVGKRFHEFVEME